MKTHTICSLFAGVGGIDIAFQQVGFKTIWANEFDSDACKTFRLNFPEVELREEDITKVKVEEIPMFDVLVGGFPCQPFSVCGRMRGFEDARGTLFFDICRILKHHRPQALLLENVANLVKHDNGNTFSVILKALEDLGYYVKYLVADACYYGLAQHRTRTYIVGFLDKGKADSFEFPEESRIQKKITDVLDFTWKAGDEWYFEEKSTKLEKLTRFIDDEEQIYRFSDYGIQKSKDGISFTLKANMGVWYDREPIIKDKHGIRKVTPRECFALQGFPDTFSIDGIPIKAAYKQAGNTVCVPLVRMIAEKMKIALESNSTDMDLTLVGDLQNKEQLDFCLADNSFDLPIDTLQIDPYKIKHIALHEPKFMAKGNYGIHHYGKVTGFSIKELDGEYFYSFDIYDWKPCDKQIAPGYFNGGFTCYLMDIIG